MDSFGQVEVMYPSSAFTTTMTMDEDDEFFPSNLITRPPSPVSGVVVDIFSPTNSENGDSANEEIPSPLMQLDLSADSTEAFLPAVNNHPDLSLAIESPEDSSSEHETQQSSSSATPFGGSDVSILLSGEEGAILFESDLEQNHNSWAESMPSHSSSQSSPPTAAAALNPALLSIGVAASEMVAVAGDGVVSFPTPPTTPPHPPPLQYITSPPGVPPDSSIATAISPSHPLAFSFIFPPVVIGGGLFIDEYELEDMTDFSFDVDLPLEDFESYNADFSKFCQNIFRHHQFGLLPSGMSVEALEVKRWERPVEITKADMIEQGCDYQAIPWDKLRMPRETARGIRTKDYRNYRNIKIDSTVVPAPIPGTREFFEFRRVDCTQRCRLIHFQLRNLLGVTSKNDVFYAGDSTVIRTNPFTGVSRVLMDLSLPEDNFTGNAVKISTLGVCGGTNGVVIAGGFNGEYAIKALHAPADSKTIIGAVTESDNGITNHVHMVTSRSSNVPNAVFASNDAHIRTLHCTGALTFVSQHEYDWAVNCSATSPDSRLRVVVGDHTDVIISDADRGSTEFTLPGHRDFGFAAAWSDDGYTIATGNQDLTVRIWDARNFGRCVAELPARMAGVRALQFSPIGHGGKRVLAMAEPADIIHLVDAVTWESRQEIDFWGEIGGISFDPTGEEFYAANVDRNVGGLFEFSRAKTGAYYEKYSHNEKERSTDNDNGVTGSEDKNFDREEWEVATGRRGRYYNSRRYKRLGLDTSDLFV